MTTSVFSPAGRRTSAFYLALFLATGVHLPFWPLWLADWGLTAAEVAFYGALGMAVRVVAAIVIPALADRLDARRHTIAVTALAGVLLFLAHLGLDSRALLLAATVAVGAVFAGIGPISEALGTAAARSYGFPYAQSRAIGSMGFLAANVVVGALIPVFGTDIALWWIVACLAGVVLLARGHPGGRRVQGQIPPNLREIGAVLVHPVFALFVAAVAFTQASHATFYALGSLHWRDLGLSEARIGALWAFSVGAEIVLMFTLGAAVVQWLGPVRTLAVSGAAGILRWGAMMADPTGFLLWPLQGLHAFTFAVAHLGAMAFVTQSVPARFGAAAQGALGAVGGGVVLALGMAISAALYPRLGGLTYGVSVASAAIGLVLVWLLASRWRGETLAV